MSFYLSFALKLGRINAYLARSMKNPDRKIEEQPNNPLHGVKLADIVEYLVDKYGFEELGEEIKINSFVSNPSIKSSLKFLRKTPWAREKVESFYLYSLRDDKRKIKAESKKKPEDEATDFS